MCCCEVNENGAEKPTMSSLGAVCTSRKGGRGVYTGFPARPPRERARREAKKENLGRRTETRGGGTVTRLRAEERAPAWQLRSIIAPPAPRKEPESLAAGPGRATVTEGIRHRRERHAQLPMLGLVSPENLCAFENVP